MGRYSYLGLSLNSMAYEEVSTLVDRVAPYLVKFLQSFYLQHQQRLHPPPGKVDKPKENLPIIHEDTIQPDLWSSSHNRDASTYRTAGRISKTTTYENLNTNVFTSIIQGNHDQPHWIYGPQTYNEMIT